MFYKKAKVIQWQGGGRIVSVTKGAGISRYRHGKR
jgi:hypothetical protein